MTEVRSVLLALLYRFSREILFMELCLLFYCLLFGKSIRFSPDRGVHNKKEARYAKRQEASKFIRFTEFYDEQATDSQDHRICRLSCK